MAHADLTVVGGAGHVGIPLVLAFAEAELPFIEYDAAPLLANNAGSRYINLAVSLLE